MKLTLLFLLSLLINIPHAIAEPTLLKNALETRKNTFIQTAPKETQEAYEQGVLDVATSGVLDTALTTGDRAPDFILPNPNGKSIRLQELLKNGPVILTWYRGGWCPYCNITLSALEKYVPSFQKYNAQLVAISPENPDKSFSTRQKNALTYHVLSDLDFQVSDAYGITYNIPPQVLEHFKGRIDLSDYNQEAHATKLPLTVTYIINTQGIITYAFVDPDYRKRAEPQDLLTALEKMHN